MKILRREVWDFPEFKVDEEVILCKLEVGGKVKLNLKSSSILVHRKDFVPKKFRTPISSNFIAK